tara:strand:- start:12149 stop:15271 length:3123 start_codon:yes stop_codon:yes gene_type:complete
MSVGYTIVNVPITAQSATYWSQTDVGSASDVMTNYYYGQPSYNYNPDGYVDAGNIPLRLIIEPQDPTTSAVSAVEFTMAGQPYDEVAQQEPLNGFTWLPGPGASVETPTPWPLPEQIEKVQFWDSGTPGQPGNTVVVYAWLSPDFAVPYNDVEITLDIDGDVIPVISTPVDPPSITLSCNPLVAPNNMDTMAGWFSGWPYVISDYITYTITNPCTDCFDSDLDYVNGVPGSGAVNNVLLGLSNFWANGIFDIPFENSSITEQSCWTITLDPYSTNGVPTGGGSCTTCQAAQEPPELIIYGCMDDGTGENVPALYPGVSALNYNPDATGNLQSQCIYPALEGCTDPDAINYNPDAQIDDNSCLYPEPEIGIGTLKISVVVEKNSNLRVCSAFKVPKSVIPSGDMWQWIIEVVDGVPNGYTDIAPTLSGEGIGLLAVDGAVLQPQLGVDDWAMQLSLSNENNSVVKEIDWVKSLNSDFTLTPPNNGLDDFPAYYTNDDGEYMDMTYSFINDASFSQGAWSQIFNQGDCYSRVDYPDTDITALAWWTDPVLTPPQFVPEGEEGIDQWSRIFDCNTLTITQTSPGATGLIDGEAGIGGYRNVYNVGDFGPDAPSFYIFPNPGYSLSRHNLYVETPLANASKDLNPYWPEDWFWGEDGIPDGLLENYYNVQVKYMSYRIPLQKRLPEGQSYFLEEENNYFSEFINSNWNSDTIIGQIPATCAGPLGTNFPSQNWAVIGPDSPYTNDGYRGVSAFNLINAPMRDLVTGEVEMYSPPHVAWRQQIEIWNAGSTAPGYYLGSLGSVYLQGNLWLADSMHMRDDPIENPSGFRSRWDPDLLNLDANTDSYTGSFNDWFGWGPGDKTYNSAMGYNFGHSNCPWCEETQYGNGDANFPGVYTDPVDDIVQMENYSNGPFYPMLISTQENPVERSYVYNVELDNPTAFWLGYPGTTPQLEEDPEQNPNYYWQAGDTAQAGSLVPFNVDNVDPMDYDGNFVEVTLPGLRGINLDQYFGYKHLVIKIRGSAMPCADCGQDNGIIFNETITLDND